MKLLNSREDSESDHGSVVKREKREASRMRECKEYILCLDIRIQSLISQTTKAPTFWADPSLHWIFNVWFESLEGFDTLISLFVPRWNSFLKILIFFFHVIYKKSMDGEERFGRANNGHQLNMEREGGGEREGHMEAELERVSNINIKDIVIGLIIRVLKLLTPKGTFPHHIFNQTSNKQYHHYPLPPFSLPLYISHVTRTLLSSGLRTIHHSFK